MNPYPLENCIIPNPAETRSLETTQPKASWFWTPMVATLWIMWFFNRYGPLLYCPRLLHLNVWNSLHCSSKGGLTEWNITVIPVTILLEAPGTPKAVEGGIPAEVLGSFHWCIHGEHCSICVVMAGGSLWIPSLAFQSCCREAGPTCILFAECGLTTVTTWI